MVLRPQRRRLPVPRVPAVPLPRPPRPGARARAARHRRGANRGAVAGNHRAPPHRGVAAHVARRARGSRRGADHRTARRAGARRRRTWRSGAGWKSSCAQVAEDGSGRPPRRRRRARLQQPADGHPRLRGSARRRPRPDAPGCRRSCGEIRTAGGARRRASRASCSPSAASRSLEPRVLDLNELVARTSTSMLRRLIGEDVELLTVARPEPVVGVQGRPAASSSRCS